MKPLVSRLPTHPQNDENDEHTRSVHSCGDTRTHGDKGHVQLKDTVGNQDLEPCSPAGVPGKLPGDVAAKATLLSLQL